MTLQRRASPLLPTLLLLGASTQQSPLDPKLQKGVDSITEGELREHVEFLASDELEGRNAGYPGNDKAAEAVAARFKECGLKPRGDGGTFYQGFTFPVRVFDPRLKPEGAGRAKARNIVGLLEGSDPRLKGEAVILGAHYDHVGREGQSDAGRVQRRPGQEKDDIWNGADDNASGTATLLEVLEAFRESEVAPKRSVLFIAFSAEEHGLYGSIWYADHPVVPLNRTSLAINLDMVGRNEDRPVGTHGVGTARNGELRKVVEEAVARAGVNAKLHAWGDIRKEDSDHYSFFRKEVPVMFFFTDFHADYHAASDTAEKLAYPNMAKIGRATFLIAVEAANRKERFLWNPPRTLGIRAGGDISDADAGRSGLADGQGGIVVEGVSPKSAADAAGLKRGDAIVEFDGVKMPRRDPLAALEAALETVEENKPVKIVILRKGQKIELRAVWK